MPDARDRELERLRAMTPAEKLRAADRLRADAFRLARAAVARRHPAWSDEQVRAEARRLVTGG
jgi:hypothetical protein